MANSAADWEGRRALTDNPNTSPQSYQNAARTLMELDQLCEAAVMFGRAADDDGLMEVIDKAVEEGNFFLFQAAASRLKGKKPVQEQLRSLIASAEKTGQALYAEKAKEHLETL